MINKEARNKALNILENGTQTQYQNEAVNEYLEAKTIAIDSMRKLEKIEQILDRTKEINGYPLNEIREVLK